MILLKNGLINFNNDLIKKDILIKDNKIVEIADEINNKSASIYNCENLLILPGLIDCHVHLREPGFTEKETIKTGTLSAAKGGFTTVLVMPNVNPAPFNLKNLNIQERIIEKDALISVYPVGCITENLKGEKIADLEKITKRVKAISDDGCGVENLVLLEEAIIIAKKNNIVITSHAEAKNYTCTRESEFMAVRREIELAKKHKAKYHFCHLSTFESFEEVRKAREEGFDITCEVTPHHLFLNETLINSNPNFKMNPPLRSEFDQKKTLEALKNNVVSIIASDHAPHDVLSKSLKYENCSNGIIGLETMIPLCYTNLIKTNLFKIDDLLNWFLINPSEVFNLPCNKIAVNEEATLICLDIHNFREYKENEILSKSKNSPFVGAKLTGFNVMTIYQGKVIWRDINE